MAETVRKRVKAFSFSGWLFGLVLVSCGDGFLPEPTPRNSESNGTEMLEELRDASSLAQVPDPTFPVRWKLTDLEGRTIDATIIGKNGSLITLIRNSDGKRFDLQTSRLSADDQAKVERLGNKMPPSRHPMESSHYRMVRAKLDDVDARIAEALAVYNSTNSSMQMRTANSQLKRLQNQRLELLEDLKELEKY